MSGYNAVLARNTESAPKVGHCSHTVAFSHYNHLSAQLPIDPASGELVGDCVKDQTKQCLHNLAAVLDSIGQSLDDVVRLTIFVTDIADLDAVNEASRSFFTTYLPARTNVAVAALPLGAKVQIEALASYGLGTIPNAPQAGDLIKVARNFDDAPVDEQSAQTVAFSHYNNISAQLPIDLATGKVISGCIKDQTRQCLQNIKNILTDIDVPFDDIVKVNIFLTSLADIDSVNEVYSTFFPDSGIARTVGYYPARTVVPAAALPQGALIQIEAVVSHGDGTPPQAVEDRHNIIVEPNNTDQAPRHPLSTQTVAFSHYNNISAQLGVDLKTGALVSADVKEQTRQCLKYIQAIVESVGHSLEDVVKVNLFLSDLADSVAVDEVYAEFFPAGTPARRTVGVSSLPGGALVQIDAVVSNAEGTPPLV